MKLPPSAERRRGRLAWFLSAVASLVAPKCLACLAVYAGLGAVLGLGGPEICGTSSPSASSLAAGWSLVTGIALAGLMLGARHLAFFRSRA
jgi:hypothetical protein